MRNFIPRVLSLIIIISFSTLISPVEASGQTKAIKRIEKKMFRSNGRKSPSMVKEPKAALKAKKAQQKKEKKGRKESEKAYKKRVKKHNDLQKPEVKARLEQNRKETDIRHKTRAKNVRKSSKKAKR